MYLGEILWIARKPVENAGNGWLLGSCIQVKIGFVALNLYVVQWNFLYCVYFERSIGRQGWFCHLKYLKNNPIFAVYYNWLNNIEIKGLFFFFVAVYGVKKGGKNPFRQV